MCFVSALYLVSGGGGFGDQTLFRKLKSGKGIANQDWISSGSKQQCWGSKGKAPAFGGSKGLRLPLSLPWLPQSKQQKDFLRTKSLVVFNGNLMYCKVSSSSCMWSCCTPLKLYILHSWVKCCRIIMSLCIVDICSDSEVIQVSENNTENEWYSE